MTGGCCAPDLARPAFATMRHTDIRQKLLLIDADLKNTWISDLERVLEAATGPWYFPARKAMVALPQQAGRDSM